MNFVTVYILFLLVSFSRPRSVDEVAFQEEVVSVLRKSLDGADVSIACPSQNAISALAVTCRYCFVFVQDL